MITLNGILFPQMEINIHYPSGDVSTVGFFSIKFGEILSGYFASRKKVEKYLNIVYKHLQAQKNK